MAENTNEYKKMIIDIPKNTKAISVVCVSSVYDPLDGIYNYEMETKTYGTKEIRKRRIGSE